MKKNNDFKVTAVVLNPTAPVAKILTKDDVWGSEADNYKGMIIARSGDTCPVFHDILPYKSVTVVCDPAQEDEVIYWLEYVHGGGSVSNIKLVEDVKEQVGKIAIRSDYQCW